MKMIRYDYDKENQLTSVTFDTGQKFVYSYDSAGNRTSSTVTLGAPIKLEPEQARLEAVPFQAPAQQIPPQPKPAAQAPPFTIPPRPAERTGLMETPAQIPPRPAKAGPMLNCPRCQSQLPPGAKFCSKCGSSVGQVAPPPSHEVEPEYTVYAEIAPKEPEKLLSRSVSCPTCHQPLKAGVRFCKSCGSPVSQAAPVAQGCPQCGKPIRGGARFCKSCGFKLK